MINSVLLQLIKETFKGIGELVPLVCSELKETTNAIVEETSKQWNEFVKKVQEERAEYKLIPVEKEMLRLEDLTELARTYKVENANEVYAWKKDKGDFCFIYLAYGKDGEPIEKEKNAYVIIKAEALKVEVKNLFKESELVVLK